MAASAIRAGYDVTVYGRWEPGLERVESPFGYRIVRVPVDPLMAVPGLRWYGRRRLRAGVARGHRSVAHHAAERRGGALGLLRRVWSARRWLLFPASILGWGAALDEVAEPHDIWHGMWIAGLPAAVRQKHRLGGAALYDSRDVYMQGRELARLSPRARAPLERIERRWAHQCDAVLTVNDGFAEMLRSQLRIRRPVVVYNCPERWRVPDPRPNLIRERLGIPESTRVALIQGGLMDERGIHESMAAVLAVPEAVLVLLGYGPWRGELARMVAEPPHRGRTFLIDAVPSSELLEWVASSDAVLMPYRPSPNYQQATPNKLFEAMAAGVPVVASDMSAMAHIVNETGCGVLVDPLVPASIADGLRKVLLAPPGERAAMVERCLRAHREIYSWSTQEGRLLDLYARLVSSSERRDGAPGAARHAAPWKS